MVDSVAPPAVPGAEDVVAWFGAWPSFHDAEILEIVLRREGTSHVRIHGWRMLAEQDAEGYFATDRHAEVTLCFECVLDLELADFSMQNVIAGLTIAATQTGYRVTIFPCFGVAGFIEAERVSISLNPLDPPAPR
jgi:hypothetical protein